MTSGLFSSRREDWATPRSLYAKLDRLFGFTVDAAATAANHKADRWFGEGGEQPDGLVADWSGERVFCNPPYGRDIGRWMEKSASSRARIAIMLVHARTDTRWFHEHVLGRATLVFIRGRIHFGEEGEGGPAPFPSMLAIYLPDGKVIADTKRMSEELGEDDPDPEVFAPFREGARGLVHWN